MCVGLPTRKSPMLLISVSSVHTHNVLPTVTANVNRRMILGRACVIRSVCVSLHSIASIQNCPIAIAIHIAQIMTRAIRIHTILHRSVADTLTEQMRILSRFTVHFSLLFVVLMGEACASAFENERRVSVRERLRLNCILKCLFQFEMVSSCFVRQSLKMLCGHNAI